MKFKFNHAKMSDAELKGWLKDNVLKVSYHSEDEDIVFRLFCERSLE